MIGMYAGIVIGATPLRRLLFRGTSFLRPVGLAIQTLGDPVIAVTVLIMAASLINGVTRRRKEASSRSLSTLPDEGSGEAAAPRRDVATIAWFILGRLVIMPAICYPLVQFLSLPGGQMTKLIILMELAMPSAQTVLVTSARPRGVVAGSR